LTRGAPRGTGQLHIHAEELKGAAEQLHAVIHGHDLDVHTGFLGITGDSKRPFLEFFRVMPDGRFAANFLILIFFDNYIEF
jgi:hypothetical protein